MCINRILQKFTLSNIMEIMLQLKGSELMEIFFYLVGIELLVINYNFIQKCLKHNFLLIVIDLLIGVDFF